MAYQGAVLQYGPCTGDDGIQLLKREFGLELFKKARYQNLRPRKHRSRKVARMLLGCLKRCGGLLARKLDLRKDQMKTNEGK